MYKIKSVEIGPEMAKKLLCKLRKINEIEISEMISNRKYKIRIKMKIFYKDK